uniref:uncharacterized protein n=1 Tax=Myxine glutinosa TaxID=7769 RepID=UPI00358F3110
MEGDRDLTVSPDFSTWLQAQGLSSQTAWAVVNELSIKSQQALLDCTEPTTVRAELYSIAREKLPFVLYAELRRFVESRYQQLGLDPSPATPVGLPTLISVLGSLLESLSLEYSHYAHKLRSLGAEQSHNQAAVTGTEETVSSMGVKIVNVCTWNPELGMTTETENEKVELERSYVPSPVSVQEASNNVIDENYQSEGWFPDSNQLEPEMLENIKVEPGMALDIQDPELASAFGEALGGLTNELTQRAILGFGSSVHQVSSDVFSGQGNGQQAVCHLDVEASSLTAMARMGNELEPQLASSYNIQSLPMAELTELQFGRKRKSPSLLKTDFTCCIICHKTTHDTLQQVTNNGYDTLLYAVTHRHDDTARRLQDDIICRDAFFDKQPKYHRRCRNMYTNKKSVDQKKRSKTTEDDIVEKTLPLVTRSSTSKAEFTMVCFICGKERDKMGQHKLTLVATKAREDTILQKAKELDDFAMLHMIQGHGDSCMDLIANDFRYHKSCLTSYLLRCRPSGKCTRCQLILIVSMSVNVHLKQSCRKLKTNC